MKIKAFAIVNTEPRGHENDPVIWGVHGIGVGPMMIFPDIKKAAFIKSLPEHEKEVARGTTEIIEVEISFKKKI
jgi:hypothetical protein